MTKMLPVPERFPSARNHDGAHSEQAFLALLADLETSLRSSQAALRARDIERIEQLADGQAELERAVSALVLPAHASVFDRENFSSNTCSDAVRAAAARVLHLGRVQSALLCRAQLSLRAIAHLLAGPHSGYGPPAGGQGIVVRQQESPSEEA